MGAGGEYCEGGPQGREWAEAVRKKRIMKFFMVLRYGCRFELWHYMHRFVLT